MLITFFFSHSFHIENFQILKLGCVPKRECGHPCNMLCARRKQVTAGTKLDTQAGHDRFKFISGRSGRSQTVSNS